jgi:MerR family redox-sensitive transcriptional activator SoxR
MEPVDLLSVGEVSRRTGVAVSALHYYEQLGLIASTRTAGNQRRYPRFMIRRISLILVAKRLGISLSDVADVFASLPMDSLPTSRDWHRLSRRWQSQLDAKKREIEKLQRELTGCIGCGCLSMKSCPLRNPWDELSEQGPGPRLLEPI